MQMVRDDFEELNRFSWPDFEGDVVGKDALAERCARPSQVSTWHAQQVA